MYHGSYVFLFNRRNATIRNVNEKIRKIETTVSDPTAIPITEPALNSLVPVDTATTVLVTMPVVTPIMVVEVCSVLESRYEIHGKQIKTTIACISFPITCCYRFLKLSY